MKLIYMDEVGPRMQRMKATAGAVDRLVRRWEYTGAKIEVPELDAASDEPLDAMNLTHMVVFDGYKGIVLKDRDGRYIAVFTSVACDSPGLPATGALNPDLLLAAAPEGRVREMVRRALDVIGWFPDDAD